MKYFVPILVQLFSLCGFTNYNHDKADTLANKKGYARHLGQQPSGEVKGIYFYADQLGADCSYQLRFECSQKTHDELVHSLGLTHAVKQDGHLRGRDFSWWNAKAIDGLPAHWKVNPEGNYYWFLWLDSAKGEAFFLEYSI
jgi:hypothetical protein